MLKKATELLHLTPVPRRGTGKSSGDLQCSDAIRAYPTQI